MPLANSPQTYGGIARALHWLTALLILTAIPLGVIANGLPYDTSEALAQKAQLFSLHKSLGVAAFAVALLRILWALTQTRPAPLHPDRRMEVLAAEVTHWVLYISMLAVPLSGWVHHAATTGFAPILLPVGQTLPFVPQSPAVADAAAAMHWVFSKLLIASVLLHVAGALKHHLIDKDATLRRMLSGTTAPGTRPRGHAAAPVLAAFAIYAGGAGLALSMVPQDAPDSPAPALAEVASGWVVSEGSLGFTVRQMGAGVEGSFADWTAAITFDEAATDGRHGNVAVTIATDSLTLGSVTPQAKSADFFDTTAHPTATFTADILPAHTGFVAAGTLLLRGAEVPVSLPFTLQIDGNTATMQGSTTLDRRDFGMGPTYTDEATVGFAVDVTISLTATRQ